LIGLLGFEAGFVLNDYVDRELDERDVEFDRLTRYWRPFGKRPLPSGLITPGRALGLFFLLVILTTALIATLPYPNSVYVFAIMVYCYIVEYIYQVKKREQSFPIAQIVGRTDFTLFPVAGYLCHGRPDNMVLLMLIFFYPWTLAHLGVNDVVDIKNDRARGMKAVTVLYGIEGAVKWIALFTIVHFLTTPLFLRELGSIALVGFAVAWAVLLLANYVLFRRKSPEAGLIALPMFHFTLIAYSVSMILDHAF
jgi:4-hydroxybenzoate polyprenyltransferase